MAKKRVVIRKKAAGAYHHGDLKTALKAAALRLVREKGPRGFSLNEASRLAGVTVGAPYRHFKDKDALLAEIACDGNGLMTTQLREAANEVTGIREKMLAVGMAYVGFSRKHSDYFAVIFNSGLDKSRYPEIEHTAKEAFGVILELARQSEQTPALASQLAVSCWALSHGLATLTADGALSTGMQELPEFEHIRALMKNFLDQSYFCCVAG